MSIFKEGFDMVTQVMGKIKDRKVVSELNQIMTILSTAQAENTELSSKNLELEKKQYALEKKYDKEISALKEQLSIEEFRKSCDFDKAYGTYVSREDGQHYCNSCLSSKGIKSPLQQTKAGWHCKVTGCDQFYHSVSEGANPDITPTPGYSWMG